MKPFILFGSSIMIIVILTFAGAFINKKDEIPEKHIEVVGCNIYLSSWLPGRCRAVAQSWFSKNEKQKN